MTIFPWNSLDSLTDWHDLLLPHGPWHQQKTIYDTENAATDKLTSVSNRPRRTWKRWNTLSVNTTDGLARQIFSQLNSEAVSLTNSLTLVGIFTCFVSVSVLLLLGANSLHPERKGQEKEDRRQKNNFYFLSQFTTFAVGWCNSMYSTSNLICAYGIFRCTSLSMRQHRGQLKVQHFVFKNFFFIFIPICSLMHSYVIHKSRLVVLWTLTISWAVTEISSQLVGGTWCSSQYWLWRAQIPWKKDTSVTAFVDSIINKCWNVECLYCHCIPYAMHLITKSVFHWHWTASWWQNNINVSISCSWWSWLGQSVKHMMQCDTLILMKLWPSWKLNPF